MKKYFVILFYIAVVFHPTASYAQIQAKFEVAKDLYQRLAYSDAIPMLEDYLAKKDYLEAKIILADCYRQNNEYIKAEEWYAKVVSDANLKDTKQNLFYAQILQTNGKYIEAAKQYNIFIAKNPNDRRAKNQYEACNSIDKIIGNNNADFVIEKLNFNTNGYDFGACLSNNKFIYTSTGGKNKPEGKINSWTGEGFMDLYSIDIDEKGNMSPTPQKWATGINTKYNEGPLCFSSTENKIYFTRNNYNPDERKEKKITYSDDREANLKIYESNGRNDSGFSNVKQLPFNDKDYSCGHPAISKDGNTLYFVSNMPGSYGGMDIWKAVKSGDTWAKPINLGTIVNTEGDEMFPFLNEEGVLYFASNGLPGLGGLDVFSYALNNENAEPKNIGVPFNTSYDDFAYLIEKSGNYGFISSNRTNGAGEDDIYKFINDKYTLEILVVDKETQLPIPNAQIDLSKNAVKLKTFTTPDNGMVNTLVSADSTYLIFADAEQYMPDSSIKLIEKDESQRIQRVKLELKSLLMQIMVIDANTKEPISNAMVTVKSKCLTEPKILQTDNTGNAPTTKVQNNCDYNLFANAKGYIPNSKDVQIINLNGIYKVVIELKQIDDKPITLNNIYYDFDKWYIRLDAEPDLNFLLLFLNTNPEAKIELSSHTDARGDDSYNKTLSQKRAEAAVNWLVAKGINAKNMKAVGYGETQPVNFCVNDVQCKEEDHQKNRRTEFKVLNAGQVTKSLPKKDMKVDPCEGCPF